MRVAHARSPFLPARLPLRRLGCFVSADPRRRAGLRSVAGGLAALRARRCGARPRDARHAPGLAHPCAVAGAGGAEPAHGGRAVRVLQLGRAGAAGRILGRAQCDGAPVRGRGRAARRRGAAHRGPPGRLRRRHRRRRPAGGPRARGTGGARTAGGAGLHRRLGLLRLRRDPDEARDARALAAHRLRRGAPGGALVLLARPPWRRQAPSSASKRCWRWPSSHVHLGRDVLDQHAADAGDPGERGDLLRLHDPMFGVAWGGLFLGEPFTVGMLPAWLWCWWPAGW